MQSRDVARVIRSGSDMSLMDGPLCDALISPVFAFGDPLAREHG